MGTGLKHALNDAVIRRLAGEQSYRRGYDYYQIKRLEQERKALYSS